MGRGRHGPARRCVAVGCWSGAYSLPGNRSLTVALMTRGLRSRDREYLPPEILAELGRILNRLSVLSASLASSGFDFVLLSVFLSVLRGSAVRNYSCAAPASPGQGTFVSRKCVSTRPVTSVICPVVLCHYKKTVMPGIAVLALFAAALPNAVVLRPVANMYSRPTEDADVVSQAIYGANVAVLEQKDGWAHIRTADDYTGWTPAFRPALGPAVRRRTDAWPRLQSLFAHIYREPDVTQARTADHRAVRNQAGSDRASPPTTRRWIEVRLPDDRSGWMQTGDVAFDAKPIGIPEMLALSKRFLGLPYTWGGTSSFGYDCSGLHPDAVPPARRATCRATPSPRQTGAAWRRVERERPGARRPAVLRQFRQAHHPYRHVSGRRQVHQRDHP